jgi:hypothetical protein
MCGHYRFAARALAAFWAAVIRFAFFFAAAKARAWADCDFAVARGARSFESGPAIKRGRELGALERAEERFSAAFLRASAEYAILLTSLRATLTRLFDGFATETGRAGVALTLAPLTHQRAPLLEPRVPPGCCAAMWLAHALSVGPAVCGIPYVL